MKEVKEKNQRDKKKDIEPEIKKSYVRKTKSK
jgi:hypothetical protein